MRGIRYVIAALACITCLLISPPEAFACSCVDWRQIGDAEAHKAFIDDWARAEVAVIGTVVAASDLETVVHVSRTFKGRVQKQRRIFPRPVQRDVQRQEGSIAMGMDCRPSLKVRSEYLILLFRSNRGVLDAERCTVWTGSELKQRLGWIPKERK